MRLAAATGWVLLGAAATGLVYWGFLNTPESTVFALIASALLALLTLALAGFTVNGTIALLTDGLSVTGLARAARRLPSVIPAALIVLVLWWVASRVDTWVALRSGEINAWFIARFGWSDMSWLFTAIRWFTTWLRWVMSALLALSLMAGIVSAGWRAAAQAAWLRRALRPRALLLATVWFVALIVLPWTYLVPWRPRWVPPTSVELVFIMVKLSLSAVLHALGVALIAREALRVLPNPTDSESAQVAA